MQRLLGEYFEGVGSDIVSWTPRDWTSTPNIVNNVVPQYRYPMSVACLCVVCVVAQCCAYVCGDLRMCE